MTAQKALESSGLDQLSSLELCSDSVGPNPENANEIPAFVDPLLEEFSESQPLQETLNNVSITVTDEQGSILHDRSVDESLGDDTQKSSSNEENRISENPIESKTTFDYSNL